MFVAAERLEGCKFHFNWFGNGIEKRHFIEQPVQPAFRARSVVTRHIDDQRIIQFPHSSMVSTSRPTS